MSRLGSVTDPFGQTVSYLYDAASNITRITYPGSGKVVNYTFDNAERMKTVVPWAGGTFTYNWRSDGLPSRLTNGNTTYTDYGYDAAARLTSLVTRYSSGTAFITQNLTLDANGNIIRILGDQPTAPPSDAPKTMTYDATNRLLTDGGSSVSHDAAGRLTSNPSATGGTATWEGRDWLATYTPTGGSASSYSYNGLGQRLARTQGGSTTRYVQDVNQSLPAVLMENNASNVAQRYYIHGLGLLASIDTGNNVTTYHFNHRGDTLALTNASQTITESYGYSPYGVTAATNSGANPFRFTGQFGVMDEGNGLQYMRARYYSTANAVFLSKDQVTGNLKNTQTLNRFAFAIGNPISGIDPSGFAPTDVKELILKSQLKYNLYKLLTGSKIPQLEKVQAVLTGVELIQTTSDLVMKWQLRSSAENGSAVLGTVNVVIKNGVPYIFTSLYAKAGMDRERAEGLVSLAFMAPEFTELYADKLSKTLMDNVGVLKAAQNYCAKNACKDKINSWILSTKLGKALFSRKG